MALQKAVRRLNFPVSPDVNRAVRLVADPLDEVLRLPLLDGRLVTGVALVSSGVTQVAHGLGREPLGYLVVSSSAAGVISDTISTSPALRDRFLELNTTVDTTVSLWIF